MTANILLVDDDAEFSEELRLLLEDFGFRVFPAACVEDGMVFLTERSFDAVILDNKMAGMSGMDLIVRMDWETRRKVIILSGQMGIENTIEEAGLTGLIAGVLGKPVDFDKLLEHLKRLTGCPAASAEL